MQWNLDDLYTFSSIVDKLSITAAAKQMAMSKSTVSKTLSRLEEALGVRLLERNSRNIRITHEGQVFHRQAIQILELARETDAIMGGLVSAPHGKLTVALPIAFAREFVAPRLPDFQHRYPNLELEMIISSQSVDIIRDQIDLAVVVGALSDSELVAKTLYQGRLIWVSSPEYLTTNKLRHGLQELQQHLKICEKRYASSSFPVRIAGQRYPLDLSKCTTQVNDPLTVREAVLNGMGVTLLPDQYCKQHLRRGELIEVFKDIHFEAAASSLSAIYPGRRLLASKTRVFLDFLLSIGRDI